MRATPQISPQTFAADLLPVLLERWQRRCFCHSPGFLKLLSFDFEDYGNVPAELLDSQMLWDAIIGEHFQPVGEWNDVPGTGGSRRMFRCPQCHSAMVSRSEQYSISIWPIRTRPTDARTIAATGLYLIGIRYLPAFDPASVKDFRLAPNVDAYVAAVTGAA